MEWVLYTFIAIWLVCITAILWDKAIKDLFRKIDPPKSKTLLFLEEQNEWSKELTRYRQARDNTRIQEHRLWNDEYEAAHTHFEQFQRYGPVNKVPEKTSFNPVSLAEESLPEKPIDYGKLNRQQRDEMIRRIAKFD